MNHRLLKVSEAASMLGIPRSTLYFWIKTGRLKTVPIPGATKRIPEESLSRLIRAALPNQPASGDAEEK